jgi:MFS transporter, DHA1 family, putative efflux transporter
MFSLLRLAIGWITLFLIGTDLFVVSPLIPLIARDFQVAVRSAGLTVTAFSLGYVVAAPIFGHLADRLGRRRVLTCCLAAFALANLLTAACGSLPAMVAARLLCGIAAAGVTPSIYVLVGSTAPAGRRGTWIAIVVTGLLSSLPLGAPIGAMASLRLGWPIVFVALAVGSLILTPVHFGLWTSAQPGQAGSTPQGRISRGPTLQGPTIQSGAFSATALVRSLAPTVVWATALYGMYTYLAAGLGDAGYGPGDIAKTVFVYGAAAFVGALLGGRLADRLGPSIAIQISLLGLGMCFVMLRLAVQDGILVGAAFAATSLLAQIFFPAQQSLLMGTFPARTATALSWNNSALFLGMAVGSLVGGQAMALGGFPAILPVSAVLAIAGWAGFRRWLSSSAATSAA